MVCSVLYGLQSPIVFSFPSRASGSELSRFLAHVILKQCAATCAGKVSHRRRLGHSFTSCSACERVASGLAVCLFEPADGDYSVLTPHGLLADCDHGWSNKVLVVLPDHHGRKAPPTLTIHVQTLKEQEAAKREYKLWMESADNFMPEYGREARSGISIPPKLDADVHFQLEANKVQTFQKHRSILADERSRWSGILEEGASAKKLFVRRATIGSTPCAVAMFPNKERARDVVQSILQTIAACPEAVFPVMEYKPLGMVLALNLSSAGHTLQHLMHARQHGCMTTSQVTQLLHILQCLCAHNLRLKQVDAADFALNQTTGKLAFVLSANMSCKSPAAPLQCSKHFASVPWVGFSAMASEQIACAWAATFGKHKHTPFAKVQAKLTKAATECIAALTCCTNGQHAK